MKSKTEEFLKRKEYFWTTEYIQERAVNYRPWYKGIRSLPYLWSILSVIVLLIWSWYVGDPFNAIENLSHLLLIVLPLWIFSAKGYRWALYVGCALQILGIILNISNSVPFNYILSIFLVAIFISAIRIENYRVKHHLVQKHTVLKDCLIALCPVVLGLLVCIPAHKMISDIYEQAGAFYKEGKGYEIYCAQQGYQMKFYPAEYYKKFDKELRTINDKLQALGSSLENAWKGIENDTELSHLLVQNMAQIMKEQKKAITLNLLSKKNSVPIDAIQWQPSYENLVTIQDVCRIIDKNAAEIVKDMQAPY